MTDLRLRPGRPDEAAALTELAMRSKAHWGYDTLFLDAVRAELTVQPSSCDGTHLVVAESGGALLGWYRLDGTPPTGELTDLWLDAPRIGQGLGGRLLRDALRLAADLGFAALRLDADPFAAPFYRHLGARDLGEVPSGTAPGRVLPRMELDVAPINRTAGARPRSR